MAPNPLGRAACEIARVVKACGGAGRLPVLVNPIQPSIARGRNRCQLTVLWEVVAVAVLGLAFGLAANKFSPRGLDLTHNYFPGGSRPLHPPPGGTQALARATQSGATAVADALAQRIRAQGLQVISGPEVRQLYDDPRHAQEQIVFVDARDKDHFEAGHIPGAYLFDHYRAQEYLPSVLPACVGAQQVVIYCMGGECEDSEFAAIMLRDAGIPSERLLVYVGGFTEWSTLNAPIETGARKSGLVSKASR